MCFFLFFSRLGAFKNSVLFISSLGQFDRISSTTSGWAPDMRTEGGAGEDGWKDARQRTGGYGGSGRIPSSPGMFVCGSQAKRERCCSPEGRVKLYLSHSDISCRCWFLWGSNCTFLRGAELLDSAWTPNMIKHDGWIWLKVQHVGALVGYEGSLCAGGHRNKTFLVRVKHRVKLNLMENCFNI